MADDLLGVAIIAAFYPNPHHPFAPEWLLLVLAGMLLAYCMRKLWIQNWQLYILGPGVLCWWGLLGAAIHPALALCPIVPFLPSTVKMTSRANAAETDPTLTEQNPLGSEMIVGSHVQHRTRGTGVVRAHSFNKSWKVQYDNGEVHHYNATQSARKLKAVDLGTACHHNLVADMSHRLQ